jgi:uncharacterized membrane protein YfcA
LVAATPTQKRILGSYEEKDHSFKAQLVYAALISIIIGFYDGFIGPGAGVFLSCVITLLGFDFLKASAHAKLVNLINQSGSILFFFSTANIICNRYNSYGYLQ